jgi:cobalt-zinc-cadmium efflux system membrane fusion protein
MRNIVIGGLVGIVLGAVIALLLPDHIISKLTGVSGHAEHGEKGAHGHGHGAGEESEEDALRLTTEQIEQSGITLGEAMEGALVHTTTFPGTVTINPDRIAIVAAKAPGVVVDLRKRLGDTVTKGELLAVLESREIAEVKGEWLAAQRSEALARTTFEREKNLFEKKISSEQDYLQARSSLEESRIRIDLARQKLAAFGYGAADLSRLGGGGTALQMLEIRAPISGRIVERRAVTGASVPSETELFTIADLSTIWVETSVAPADLGFVKEGDNVGVEAQSGAAAKGLVVFVSPVIDRDTRLAKMVAQIANADASWRPGDFATVRVDSTAGRAAVLVPRGAIQRMKKDSVVFVRNASGFEKRDVVLGRNDGRQVEIRFGIEAGEKVAVGNSFILKAQLEKSEAEHAH